MPGGAVRLPLDTHPFIFPALIVKVFLFSLSHLKLIPPLIKTLLTALLIWGAILPAHAESPLALVIENQTYFYNVEHTQIESIDEGFTLTGNLSRIFFRYDLVEGVRVEVGALLDLPFGEDDRLASADPIITLRYGFAPDWEVTAGTIDRNHALHDAFFDDTLRYTDPIEQGFQIKGNTRFLKQDIWIDWEERETTHRREKFSLGNVTRLEAWGFMLEGQIYWVHRGGQKNSGPGVFNNLSLGAGAGYTYRHHKTGGALSFLDEIGFTVHHLYNQDDPPALPLVDEEGLAVRAFATLWDTHFYYLNWDGGSQNFNSARGDILQPGIPLAKGDPFYKASNFWEVGVNKTWQLADKVTISVDLRGQFVLDQFEQIYAFNFTWRDSFPLFEDYFKKRQSD